MISTVTAGDKGLPSTPLKKKPNNNKLRPCCAIVVINYAKDVPCTLVWIMGSEENKMFGLDLSIWMDVTGWNVTKQLFEMDEKSNYQIL